MNLIVTAAGALLGGTIFGSAGAVCGGLFGWLLGNMQELRQRQSRLEAELAALRHRVAFPGVERPVAAAAPVPAAEEIIDLSGADLLPEDDAPAPTFSPPRKSSTSSYPSKFRAQRPLQPAAAPSSAPLWLQRLCSGENLLVKLGVLILFCGVSFLVKYAAQRGFFPIELRLTAAALGGCALLAVGWKVRGERPVYAQVIQGGGVGILYLTTYAAMALYHLLPTTAGFILLIVTCALAAILALLQDARPLAVMGSVGGFLAPLLASIGSGAPAMLFGYYAVLNAGIIAIAYYRTWRELTLLGFVGTFIVSAIWGGRFYQPAHFAALEPFLVLFFVIYTLVPLLFARQQPAEEDGYRDLIQLCATPVLAITFQQPLVRQFEYGLAWSSLAAGCFYLLLAGRLCRSPNPAMRLPREAFLALGTLFATLTFPLALDNRWTAAAWSLEGAVLVWVGLRRERRPARCLGYLVLVASGVAFAGELGLRQGAWPLLNSYYSGCLLIAGAALLSARLLDRAPRLPGAEAWAEKLLFAWGMLWWFAAGLHEVDTYVHRDYSCGAMLLFVAASCRLCAHLRRRLDWRLLEWPALGLLPAMAVTALWQLLAGEQCPSLHGGWFGWPIAFALCYLILRAAEGWGRPLPRLAHPLPLWLATLLIAWELHGRISLHLPGMVTWAICAWGAVPALVVLLLARYRSRLPWPVAGRSADYLGAGALPLAATAWFWLLWANLTQAGNPWPLPYLPLLNPLDLVTLLVLAGLVTYYRALEADLPELAGLLPRREALLAFGGSGFLCFNALLLRTIHHWRGVPYSAADLFASLFVQATLSIVWSLLALVAMTYATRRGLRSLWLAGGALLGVVVGKLFLVDLAGQGSVARIVSFVSVGLLLLLVGWFSPVPPQGDAEGGQRN